MDELSALKLIFRQQLTQQEDKICIRGHVGQYEIDGRTMKIRDPAREYADVYDYILNDVSDITVSERTAEVDAVVCEVEKITEEQFCRWKSSRAVDAASESEGLTGKEIWMQKKAGEIVE